MVAKPAFIWYDVGQDLHSAARAGKGDREMGFLGDLLKRETRKMVSTVVDGVVDSVMDHVNGAFKGNDSSAQAQAAPNVAMNVGGREVSKRRENETGDDRDCLGDRNIVRQRIEMAAAEGWSGYELRRDIPAAEVGADQRAHGFDYGLYLNGRPKVMIMLLDHYQYRNQSVQRAHAACKSRGIGSFNLLMHLPNRKTYIAERIKAVMPS